MSSSAWSPLSGVPAYPDGSYAHLADRLAALLGTNNDVLLFQGEAILALEAVAASVTGPGLSALNIVTSPYGRVFGDWLGRGGARVRHLVSEPGRPIDPAAVRAALDSGPGVEVVSLAHGEAASGIVNPVEEIAAAARDAGALVIVDAVASVGGHALEVDALGIDVAVIGPQKALAGPAGVSAASVSERAWARIDDRAPEVDSILSLSWLKRSWLERGRPGLPGMPDPAQFWALEAALDRVEAEGVRGLIARHARAARAARAGVHGLGVPPWESDPRRASNLVTAVPVPDGARPDAFLARLRQRDSSVSGGVGEISGRLVRLNHTGVRASFPAVLTSVIAYGATLAESGVHVDLGAAASAIVQAYS